MTPISQLPSAWDPAPLVLAGDAIALALFVAAFRRLRRRGRSDHASVGRALLFVTGLAVMTLPLVSPLDTAADEYLLSAHMLEHVLVGDAGPALVLLGVRGPLLAFMLTAPVAGRIARIPAVREAGHRLGEPWPCLLAWTTAIAVWHIPVIYDATLTRPALHQLEHVTFITTGFLVWNQLLDPARHDRFTVGNRLAYAGVLLLAGQILANILLLTTSPLYPAYADIGARLFGISPLADQQFAGLVMMGEQLATLGAFATVLLVTLVRHPHGRPVVRASAETRLSEGMSRRRGW
ncbi:MAG: cytochrome c oxidase assembly protein [Actinomycetes bacterium]